MEISTKGYAPRSGKFQSGVRLGASFLSPRLQGEAKKARLEINAEHQSGLMALEIDEIEIAA